MREGAPLIYIFKSFGKALLGKTKKTAAKTGVEKALTMAVTKTGEHVGKKAGDKIVNMLSKSGEKKVTFNDETVPKISQQLINQRVNQILSGGRIRKRKII